MANFVNNSSNKQAVRMSEVVALEIIENDGDYILLVKTSARPMDLSFETDTSLAGIQSKSNTLLTALNA